MGEARFKQFRSPCAYCGTMDGKLTNDHVPPTSVLLHPYPRRITVRACESCNATFASEMDVAFQVFLSVVIGVDDQNSGRLWRERAVPTLKSDRPRLIDFMESRIPLYDGSDLLGFGIPFPADLFRSMIRRLARAVYFRGYRTVLGIKTPIQAEMVTSLDDHINAFGRFCRVVTVGDQFGCMFGRTVDDPKTAVFMFHFHNRLLAVAYAGSAANADEDAVGRQGILVPG